MFTFKTPDGREDGPHPTEQIKIWMREGLLTPYTPAKKTDEETWKTLGAYREFFAVGFTRPPISMSGTTRPFDAKPLSEKAVSNRPFRSDSHSPIQAKNDETRPQTASHAAVSNSNKRPSAIQKTQAALKRASCGDRVVAKIIDLFFWWIALMPLAVLFAVDKFVATTLPEWFVVTMYSLGTVSVFGCVAVNFWLAMTRGWSLGKRILKIRVVDKADQVPTALDGVLLRGVIWPALCIIPIVPLLDLVFLLGEDAETLHDKFSMTRVVDDED